MLKTAQSVSLTFIIIFSSASLAAKKTVGCSIRLGDKVTASTTTAPITIQRPFRVVIFGVGDVIRRYVGPALDSIIKSYGQNNVQRAFIDTSEFWAESERKNDMIKRISDLEASGAVYIDRTKLGTQAFRQALLEFKPDAIFIETPDKAHIANMRDIIDIFTGDMPYVFFDKPFGANVTEVREFLNLISSNPKLQDKFRGIDHFKAMIKPKFLKFTDEFLGGDPEYFHFYLVENHTPTDPKYVAPEATKNKADAIGREGRQSALQNGLALDLFTTHGGAQVSYFGKLETAVMTSIKAGQYEHSPIPAETFGQIAFDFESYRGNKIHGFGTYGKGILGAEQLGDADVRTDFDHETFALDLRRGSRRLVANFSVGFVDVYENGKRIRRVTDPEMINTRPYDHIMDNTFRFIAGDQADGLSHTVDPKAALTMLEWADFILGEVRSSIRAGTFPVYSLRVGNEPPTVEQILSQISRSSHLRDGNIWSKP